MLLLKLQPNSAVQMLLLLFTTAPYDKSIGVEYCQKNKWKSVADTRIDTVYEKYRWYLCQYSEKVSPILLVAIPVLRR